MTEGKLKGKSLPLKLIPEASNQNMIVGGEKILKDD
jgi:hypothetical protein